MATTANISGKARNPGPEVYYQSAFRDVIEMHLPLMLKTGRFTIQDIEPSVAYKNENDFYGLLNDFLMDVNLFWPTLRINGFYEPSEYPADKLAIIIPDSAYLDQLRRMHTTIHQIR